MTAGLRMMNQEMQKASGWNPFARGLGETLQHAAGNVDMVRAVTHGGGIGAAGGLVRSGLEHHKLLGMSHEVQQGLIQKAGEHAGTLAAGGKLSAEQAVEHQHGLMLQKMHEHMQKDEAGRLLPMGEQIKNPMGLVNGMGAHAAQKAIEGAALGTAAHATGQAGASALVSHKASKYIPLAIGGGALGGYAAARNS